MSRRKAEMVLELIDRATRPARRFIAMQQRMGKAVEMANRIATRTARTAGRATDLYTRAVQGLDRAQDALQRGIRRSNDLIRRQVTQMRTATGMMRNGAMGVGRAGLLAGTMLTAYAGTVALAGTALLAPARQFEKFQTILTTTEGSAQAAEKAMGWVENFAVKTPYELDQVMAAFVQLRAYGLDPTNGMLKSLGDASAAMGKPLMQSVEAMADAVTGENERLKELGIKAAKVGKYFEYSYTGKDGTDKVVRALASDRQAIQNAILGIFDERYAGAMGLLAQTFDGIISNIKGIWTKFQRMIAASGVFDWMKGKLSQLLDMLNAWDESGRLEEYAVAIGAHITTSLEAMWSFGAEALRFWQQLYPWIERAKDALGGWRNFALALLAIPLRGVLLGTAFALLQIAGGAALAAKAVAFMGFGTVAKSALTLGSALLGLANPINWVKGAFYALRVALISTGIGALVLGLAMAGLWIYNNWSGLKSFFKGFGEAFMKSLGPAQPLAEGVIRTVRRLWDWIGRLVGPLDATAEQWAEWGRAAGRWVGESLAAVQRFFDRMTGWFTGGQKFDLASLVTPLAWSAALIPLLTIATFRRLAVGAMRLGVGLLFTPLVWGAKLLPRLWPSSFLKLAVGGSRLFVSGLIKPLVWGLSLVPKLPWLALAGGGKLFGLANLIKKIVWTLSLIGGPIGWVALLGLLAWDLLIKKIDWSQFEWLNFEWSDILPEWSWDWIPSLNLADKLKPPSGSSADPKERERAITRGNSLGYGQPVTPIAGARAKGGPVSAGLPYLVGERGPEIHYSSKGGYIAHNRALERMAALSRQAVQSNRLASLAGSGLPDEGSSTGTPVGSQYLTSKSSRTTSISAPITLTIQGNVDEGVMPDLKAALEEMEERLAARFDDEARGARRREHG